MIKIPQDMVQGTVFKTNNSGDVTVVSYNGWDDVLVQFKDTGNILTVKSVNLRAGRVKDLMAPSVCGVGCIGIGMFKASHKGKVTSIYKRWSNLINHCYDKDNDKYRYYGAKGKRVCDEWLNYQVFANWFVGKCVELGEDPYNTKLNIVCSTYVYGSDSCELVFTDRRVEKAQAKHYVFVSPKGVTTRVYNLNKFCRDNQLVQSLMHKVLKGERTHHKGWRVKR